ncbi:MAG TPA: bifunctional 4-hydroxy-2-oxoglutarate aldolase/2-dehydro-3-deoxy-phosphogluconate aldolase [Puia sp.]|nr:bifunctional 4-hydroxy-2-oxoglutarate aldolase/2-dehydro-3-deoxy-phosphogluconate aldolase [Puia sp.]
MVDKNEQYPGKGLFSWTEFLKVPVIGIARNIPLEAIIQILPLYQSSGLTSIEITMNSDGAEDIIRYASLRYKDHLNIGAGTVCSLDDLDRALVAGAQFIVTPVMEEDIIRRCKEIGIPVFPGAFTPSEIYNAWKSGADMVKVFPASVLGPQYIRELRGPLNQVKLMPTGGINSDNATAFLRAGASALAMGSELMDKKLIRDKNWKALSMHFEQVVKNIKEYTGNPAQVS